MPFVVSDPEAPATGVRTPETGPVVGSRPCPVCLRADLRGQQTVCSAACRRERARARDRQRLTDAMLLLRAQLDDLLAQVSTPPRRRRPSR